MLFEYAPKTSTLNKFKSYIKHQRLISPRTEENWIFYLSYHLACSWWTDPWRNRCTKLIGLSFCTFDRRSIIMHMQWWWSRLLNNKDGTYCTMGNVRACVCFCKVTLCEITVKDWIHEDKSGTEEHPCNFNIH